MSRWFSAPRPRNGSDKVEEATRAKRESERALQQQRAQGREVNSLLSTLKQIREKDGLSDLFGRAIGGGK